ncbi:MAG: hypothetical protein J7642_21295 [Cyanobacteria bacterium SBC]|nr:hypothetical protein [Cyanobacteria bacterium SBC]
MGLKGYGDISDTLPGIEGQRIRTTDDKLHSGVNAGTAPLPFGSPVQLGTNSGEVLEFLPISDTIGGSRLFGVSVASYNDEIVAGVTQTVDGRSAYAPDRPMAVMSEGVVGVVVEEPVTPSDEVYYRYSANTGTVLGRWRMDDDTDGTNAHAAQIANARFLRSSDAGEVVPLEIGVTIL